MSLIVSAPAGPDPLCRLDAVSVRFGSLLACRRVSLDLRRGEVHALVGENGAGKSTIMHALAGVVRPSEGSIEVEGGRLPPGEPRAASQAGVAMVFQRFRLVPALSVAENVVLGLKHEPWWLRRQRLNRKVQQTADRFALPLRAEARIADLGEGARQQVEILRVLYRGAKILILDEPTSVLAPSEAEQLMVWIRQRAAEGVGVYLISHKLPEVLAAADRISVLRRGEVVARDLVARECSVGRLTEMMMGERDRGDDAPATCGRGRRAQSKPCLSLTNVGLRLPGLREELCDVSLEIERGEILGIAGVSGNGQRLLAHVAAGLLAPARGCVRVEGNDLTGCGVRAFIEAGVGYAPENRDRLAVARSLSVKHNAVLRSYRQRAVGTRLFLSWTGLTERARRLIRGADVRTPSLDAPASALSGGNLQRLILARETEVAPRLFVVDQPTQGLDIVAAQRVHARLCQLRDLGMAVLLISSDLDEILTLADRLIVLYRGCALEVPGGPPFDRQVVGRLMLSGVSDSPGEVRAHG